MCFRTHQQKQGFLLSPPPFRFPQSATPPALRQGEKHPLTVLIFVAFAHQRNGSGKSRMTTVDVSSRHFFSTIHGHF
jgi:hypothetical protein